MGSIIILNSYLVAVSLFYTQTYLICLPAIVNNILVPYSLVQLAFTGNILCFGMSQLFYGPFSDYYGRKKCLLAGLWIALVGNVLSLFSNNITMFFIGQLISGLGAGSCSVIPRAISKDILTDRSLVKAISYMSVASTLATGLAPILGGVFQEWFGWRSVFFFLNGLTIITLILVSFFMPETVKEIHKVPLKWQIIKNYGKLFSNKLFLFYIMLNSCVYSGVIIYLMLSPFLFQTTLSYSASLNSLIYLLCASCYLFGNLFLSYFIERLNVKNIMWLGVATILMGSIFMIMPMGLGKISITDIILCGLLIHLGSGLVTPMTYKQILDIPEFTVGISSAAINAVRVLIAFIFSSFVAIFSLQSVTALAYILGILSTISVGIYFLLSKIYLHKMEEKLA